MEILLGFVLAFVAILFIQRFILTDRFLERNKINRIVYRQSHIYSLIAPMIPYLPLYKRIKPTQSFINDEKKKQVVIFTEDKAYWIKNNGFYEALLANGEIDDSTIKIVDTMTMDKVELDKMIFIVEKLREGMKNDFGSSGL
jgi:hypothetical protein